MSKINYTDDFQKAVGLNMFLGMGNPNGQILILGKEAAIDTSVSKNQYEREIENNIKDWNNNIKHQTSFSDVANWIQTGYYNPLYPYKGQLNKVESRDKSGKIIRGKAGTSKTWYNYQKISDCLFNAGKSSNDINFQEHFFISELNQETAKYSQLIAKEKREESIAKRVSLFETEFFRSFPVTIVAVGHYVRDFNINLESLFSVTYDATGSKKYSEGLKNEYLNIHFDNPQNPKRLLIHTNQLSMVSNDLVTRLGVICQSFLSQNT